MDDQIRQMTKEAKELITGLYNACDSMDEHDLGTRKWLPDKSTREIQELSFYTYFLYIAAADGEITQEEADVINELLGGHYSLPDFKLLADKMKVADDATVKEVPLVIRAAVECDNKGLLSTSVAVPFYQSYIMLGFLCMLSDLHVRQSEYDRTLEYLRRIHTYLEENLDNTAGITDPSRQLQDMIAKLGGPEDGTAKAFIEPDRPGKTQKDEQKSDKKDDGKDEKTLEELLAELNSLIGLDEVKYDVISLINLVRIREIREKMGLQMPPISLHLVFSGNPGTGKTTVARLLAKIYHKIGILSQGQLVEVDRSGLVAGYVGQTALKVQDVLSQAKGGVLFIDEAYALTPEHAMNDYGLEAIDTLVKGMEDFRDDLIVIVAGYTVPMQRFITANPGLKSRFNKFIEFPDYTAEELTQIFKRFCAQNKYRASRPALKYVFEYFQNRIENKPENFANAREARNLFEFAVARQANRVIIESNPTEDMITLIKTEDVAGQSNSIGKQQFLAENAFAGLGGKRDGIPNELLLMKLDELELTPKCWHALQKEGVLTVGQVLDWLDGGKALTAIENLSDKNEQEIREGLKSLGWTK